MRAVGAGAADDVGAAVEQERDVAALHRGGDRLGAVDQRALVGIFETQQHGGDIAGGKRASRAGPSNAAVSSSGGVTR